MRLAHVQPLLPVVAALGVLACAVFPTSARALTLPSGFTNDVVVAGLNQPSSFAFLPDGRVFVTEQTSGKVRLIVNGHVAATDPALIVPSLSTVGQERGLLGIAVDPAWPSRPYVYLYYNRTGDFVRLVRYTASGNLTDSSAENVTLASPLLLIDDIPDVTIYHQAGCLRFGTDGMLYLSLGDDAYDCLAFDLTSLHGCIVRLDVDGLPPGSGGQVARSAITPSDNPFVGNANANAKLVYVYGLRNPFRFQVDPVTGNLYGCDVGEDTYEEMNAYVGGNFYGWPYREANLIRTLPDCPEPGGAGHTPYIGPIATMSHDGNATAIISGGMYRPAIGGTHNWPSIYYPNLGDIFYTNYYSGDLLRITWNGSSWVPAAPVPGQPSASVWGAGFVNACDFLVGPDGSLYWMAQWNANYSANSGSLNRVRFNGNTSVDPTPPLARTLLAMPNPFGREVDLSFRLDAPERVRLAIYDLSGRRIAELLDGEAPIGETTLHWNGHDADGATTSAGVYFARFERLDRGSAVTVPLFRTR